VGHEPQLIRLADPSRKGLADDPVELAHRLVELAEREREHAQGPVGGAATHRAGRFGELEARSGCRTGGPYLSEIGEYNRLRGERDRALRLVSRAQGG